MIYLNKEEIIAINKLILSKAGSSSFDIQYSQGLDLVVEQPQQIIFGKELYSSIWLKSAFIIQKLTKKHCFMDGNKRTAFLSGITFLYVNGFELDCTTTEGEKMILMVTNNPDNEETMLRLAEWLKKHSKKLFEVM